MGKEEFKEALFETVEVLIQYQLSNSGKKLVQTYFNDADGETTLDRAIAAIKKYTSEELPPPEVRGKKLKASLNRLAFEAKQWDAE